MSETIFREASFFVDRFWSQQSARVVFALQINISALNHVFVSLFINKRSHVLEKISHINDIQSLLTASPMAMNLEYAHSRNLFNFCTIFEKERYHASTTVNPS
jgi:hypothetical protein